MQDSALGVIDKILGFVFGILRGLLLIAVAYLIFVNISTEETVPQLETAATRPLMVESAAVIEENLPESVPEWFGERIDALMQACRGGAPDTATVDEQPDLEEATPLDEPEPAQDGGDT